MITELEHLANIPITTSTLVSLFSDVKAGNQKVRNQELNGNIIRLKKGLYVVNPKISHAILSTELIANHLSTPESLILLLVVSIIGVLNEILLVSELLMLTNKTTLL